MNNGKLVLAPKDPLFRFKDKDELQGLLKDIELIDRPLDQKDHRWLVGDRFMQWIGFMGCSPFILLKPDGGKPFCHIRIDLLAESPRLRVGDLTKPPKCPNCKQLISNWKDGLAQQKIACGGCDKEHAYTDFTWRRHAGLGCCFIEISNIFQGEAAPVDGLFQHLKALTGQDWLHFYLQNEQ